MDTKPFGTPRKREIRAERGGRLLEHRSLLAYIKKRLVDVRYKKITKWHKTKMQEREACRRGHYAPWTKSGITPILGNAPKKVRITVYQLKVGHEVVEIFFLVRIG